MLLFFFFSFLFFFFTFPLTHSHSSGQLDPYEGLLHPLSSVYLKLVERNRCNHRDFQNLAVNGADSVLSFINLQALRYLWILKLVHSFSLSAGLELAWGSRDISSEVSLELSRGLLNSPTLSLSLKLSQALAHTHSLSLSLSLLLPPSNTFFFSAHTSHSLSRFSSVQPQPRARSADAFLPRADR
jgi:hypothetical protein